MNKDECKELFISIYRDNIKRDGSEKLLEYLMSSDFFDAPCSTRFHNCFEGGLCEHSIHVYERLMKILKDEFKDKVNSKYTMETIALVGLLHDICKVNYYKVEMRNTKVNNVWEQVPFYTVEDSLPYGHGEKSVYIISGFMKLSREEAMAINWHMGGFDARILGNISNSSTLRQAFNDYPLAFFLHTADMMATYLDEKQTD